MSGYEVSHKKPRLTLARVSDHANHRDGANASDPRRDRENDGRFKKGNRAAAGTGPKRKVRHFVPLIGRKLFDALCAQIGATGGTLAYLHAADAVNHYLAAGELASIARAKGLDTEEGKDADERATRHSEAGLRAATAALETARLFKRPGIAKRPKAPPPGFDAEETIT